MKSLDEAARDYWDEGFNAGVEFAQRWIPVEEVLPPEDKEILFKNDNRTFLGTYENKTWYSYTDEEADNITHWREIEIELKWKK